VNTALFVGLALTVAAPSVKEPPKKDPPSLVGSWEIESVVKGGKAGDENDKGSLDFTADGKATLKERGREMPATYTSDPKKSPAELDLTIDGGGMQVTMKGIWKIEKDTMTLCLSFMGERPKTFEAPDMPMTVLLTLKRVKKD